MEEQSRGKVSPRPRHGKTHGRLERAQRIIGDLQVRASEFSLIISDDFPLGGRLRHFIDFWRQITHDPTVLHAILGVELPFIELPSQAFVPRPYQVDEASQNKIRKLVEELLEQQIVVPVDNAPDQFVSPLFIVTNKDQSSRAILNVKKMNQDFLQTKHFKMETLLRVLPLIRKGDWFGSWDLRKGYYNVAVHPAFQKYFCFDLDGQRFMFKSLVMGISVAPFIFTKIMAALVQFARAAGIDVSFYIDDTLIRASLRLQAWTDIRAFGQLLQLAGFLLHESKSVTEPTQEIKYFGFFINSVSMTLRLPEEKEQKIRSAITTALQDAEQQCPWTIRKAAQLIGWLLAAIPAVRYGEGHFRSLENVKKWALVDADNDYDAPEVFWNTEQCQDMQWWLDRPSPIVRCFQTEDITDTFTSKKTNSLKYLLTKIVTTFLNLYFIIYSGRIS